MKFFAMKLNISENIFNSNFKNIKEELIPKRILSFAKEPVNRKDEWTLVNVKSLDNNIIMGDVAKPLLQKVTQIDGSVTKEVAFEYVQLSPFYYFVKEEIILCHPYNTSNKTSVFNHFKGIISRDAEIGDVDIRLLSKTKEFEKNLLSENYSVRKLELDYVTPNDPRTLNEIQDIITENNAKTGKLTLENKEEGLKVKSEDGKTTDFIKNLLQITRKGFGNIKATLVDQDNKKTVIETKENPIKKTIDEVDKENIEVINRVKGEIMSSMEDGEREDEE
ncbi:DUF4747 family protein [Ligilactobacillus equi]|uniref:Uncharacterized protein n=1 Tax=Ligilactobacillus equi DSM 15833 = JCM 10991 TaxID=1423740 RepID=A0A0R1TGV9_9LACO|nr:DUF4747 family protein [Ligilactobacillus equi]KRL80540.1 hypothetical protein FC36_GL002137 [Ligilactobacillus equi DSM 15833 = JCM 10991]